MRVRIERFPVTRHALSRPERTARRTVRIPTLAYAAASYAVIQRSLIAPSPHQQVIGVDAEREAEANYVSCCNAEAVLVVMKGRVSDACLSRKLTQTDAPSDAVAMKWSSGSWRSHRDLMPTHTPPEALSLERRYVGVRSR
jgi:hypothetical protein